MNDEQLKRFYGSISQHLNFLKDISLSADGDDTVNLINKTINQYAHSDFVKECVRVITAITHNEFQFCKALFEIACKLIQYRRDPDGHEIIFTPALLVRVRQGDCKKFTTWICAVLKNAGIKCATKVVNYDAESGWQHIYAIAFPTGYTSEKGFLCLDPVNHKRFDSEVNYYRGRVNFLDGSTSKLIDGNMAKLSIMGNVPGQNLTFLGLGESADSVLDDLETISGRRRGRLTRAQLDEVCKSYVRGVGEDIISGPDDDEEPEYDGMGRKRPLKQAVQKTKAAVKKAAPIKKAAAVVKKQVEKRSKIVQGAKKAGFAPVRAAFITLLHAGNALAQYTPIKFNLAVKVAELWKTDNGKALTEIWQKFGGKPEALKKAIIQSSKMQISGIAAGGGGSGVIIAAVTAGAPILALVIKLLHNRNLMKKQEAARNAALVEDIEDANTDASGNMLPATLEAVKMGLDTVTAAFKTDDGGDREAVKFIKDSASQDSPTQTYQDAGQQTSENQDQQATYTPPGAAAGGFQLLNPSSWITGAIAAPLYGEIWHLPEAITGTVSALMFLGGVYLSIKNSFQKT